MYRRRRQSMRTFLRVAVLSIEDFRLVACEVHRTAGWGCSRYLRLQQSDTL